MIGIINGSPKAPGGASGKLAERVREKMGGEAALFSARGDGGETCRGLASCETVMVVFPIYVDALPSHLLRFLMNWEVYRENHGGGACRMYAISHAGFYEGKQCFWSLEVLRNFCARADIEWLGGIGLGGSAVLGEKMPDSMVKPLFAEVDALCEAAVHREKRTEYRWASIGIPRWMYRISGNMGWTVEGKQNGLKKSDLYRVE